MSQPEKIPAYVTLAEGVEVTFAAKEDGALAEFDMVAYTGKPVQTWFGDMVVDLAGMKLGKQKKPVFLNHDTGTIFGHSTKMEKTPAGQLLVRGVASGMPGVSDQVTIPARNGFPWQASMGFSIDAAQELDKDTEREINGRKFKGPMIVVGKSTLKEVSFVPLGADDQTSAVVFGDPATCGTVPLRHTMLVTTGEPAADQPAGPAPATPAKELRNMTKDEIIQQAPDVAEAIRGEGADRERARVRAMREAFGDRPDFVAESIVEGLTIEQATVKYLALTRTELADVKRQLADAKKALGDESGAVGFVAPKPEKPADEPPAAFDSHAAQAKWEWEHKKTADGSEIEQCSDEVIYTRFRVAQLSGRVKIKDGR